MIVVSDTVIYPRTVAIDVSDDSIRVLMVGKLLIMFGYAAVTALAMLAP